MSVEARQREAICRWGASLFGRGLTPGASGNISVRVDDDRLLVTPTGRTLADLDPAELSVVERGRHVAGLAPTKELPLHLAFYETRPQAGAVVHLHSTYAVAWSTLPDVDPENALPPLTPYSVMRIGKAPLLPFFVPGDPAMADAVRALGGRRSAVLLANHGPVTTGRDLDEAVYAAEEFEETARLALITHGMGAKVLCNAQIAAVVDRFEVDWR